MKEQIVETASQATKLGGGFIAFLGSFFTPIYPAMIAAGVLIGIDTITGVMKAHKKGGLKSITSRRLSSVLSKLLLYNLLIISARLCEEYLVSQLPFVKLVLGAIALVEFKSILENTSEYLGKDIVKAILNKISRKAE